MSDEFWTRPAQLTDFTLVKRGDAYPLAGGDPTATEPGCRYLVKYRFYMCGQKYGVAAETDDPSDAALRLMYYANLAGTMVQYQVVDKTTWQSNDAEGRLSVWKTQYPLSTKWPSP